MNMNRIIHFLSTSRTALILLLATLLTATAAQTAGAQELTDFLTVSSSGTASGYFAFSDHFYRVDWSGINTSKTTSVQLYYNEYDRLRASTNNDPKSSITLYASASNTDYWMPSQITGLTPGQSSDGYTTYADLATGAQGTTYPPTYKKVCTVTCMAANTPTWNWSADNSTCTATFTCTASPSLTTTVNATVTRSGSTATASATFNGTNYTDTKTIVTNYSITYVLNGGTNAAGNPTTYADNVGVSSFANPTRTGYTFAGWYDNASFTGSPVTNIPAGSSGDKTLYAKWDIGLTYNTTGGYYEISNAQDLVVLANYVKGGNNASGKTFKQTADITLSGNFEPIGSQPNSYNPTPFSGIYDGQGHAITGLAVDTSSPYAGLFGYMQGGSVRNLTMVNPNVTSNDYSRGAKYAGGIVGVIQSSTIENCKVINPTLKTSSGNGNNNKGAICGGITGGYCVVTDCYFYTTGNVSAVGWNGLNVSVTASRTYTLTLNDGITTSTAPTFSYGGTRYYVSGTIIALGGLSDRTGYTSDYAVSGNVTVTDNQFAMPDGDVTVTAVYTPITYTITYHAGEGVDFSTEKNAYTVESATITLDQPSPKTGYTFSGWYGNAGLTGDAITAIATGSTGDMVLWAKWTANTYTVHFEPVIPVYGTMADQTFTYDQTATALTKNAFSTTTGQWLRWNTEADGSGTNYADEQEVQNLTAEDGGVVTLYAQWHLAHRFNYNNTIFHCYKVDTPNEVYRAYEGETVKVEVIDGTSEYTIYVTGKDGTDITLDTKANTFVMPDQEVYITSTSVKKMAYTTISLDNFESGDDVVYLYNANQPTVMPTVVVKDRETVLTEGKDYTVEITNNTGSATQMVTATVTVTGMGGYVGTNTLEFRITPFNIANCEIKGTLEAYNDDHGVYYPLERNVQVWNGETQLKAGTDYSLDVEYAESYVVGQSYNATIKGTGDWGGSQTFQFKVVALHHTVVFDANGGTGTMKGGTVANDGGYAGKYYLTACGFTAPDGKKFDHWVASCEPDAEKQPGDYFTAPYIYDESDVQTITVTAYWRDKATCTVTLPEEMEVVSGTLTDGKAIEDEVITFRPRPGFTATDVQANGTALTPDGESIYTLTVTAEVTVTATFLSTRQSVTVAYINADGTPAQAQAVALDGTETSLAEGWYFVGKDISYTATVTLGGDVHLILADGKTMNVTTTSDDPEDYCINAPRGESLHIYGQTEGTGALNAQTQGNANGVIHIEGGTLGIHGGNVTATVGGTLDYLLAICVQRSTAGDALVIDRGTLTANGNNGSGIYIEGGDAHINGGQVAATGASAGINVLDAVVDLSDLSTTIPGILTLSGGTLTASCFDTYSGDSYAGTLAVASGLTYTDGTSLYDFATETATLAALGGKTLQPCLALADAADNTAAIIAHAGMTLPVALSGRTLYKDGSWNTLCLPFSLDADQLAASPLAGCTLMKLETTSNLDSEGKLTLNFASATTIEAGNPYIIKWDGDGTANIENPVFEDVTITATAPTAVEFTNNATVTGVLTFTGTYAPVTIPAGGDNTKLYLGNDNTLYYPNGEMTIGCQRAYFQLADGLTAGDATSLIRAFVLNFGEETTGIISVHDSGFMVNGSDAWYTLDGRRLDGKPTQRGIYINNGKKVAIK